MLYNVVLSGSIRICLCSIMWCYLHCVCLIVCKYMLTFTQFVLVSSYMERLFLCNVVLYTSGRCMFCNVVFSGYAYLHTHVFLGINMSEIGLEVWIRVVRHISGRHESIVTLQIIKYTKLDQHYTWLDISHMQT